ncbi:hypothetical protein GGR57DRAFT_168954 [Xylariaceae sp. FL1272]|nr:hypothetical protein GGR57DRAFT_168954 [Xylariaceae sp. FL1272]
MSKFKEVYEDYYDNAFKYEFLTEMSPGVWKITRKCDRMEYLAHDVTDTLFNSADGDVKELTQYGQLLRPNGLGMLRPVKKILNHDNLVCMVDCFAVQISHSGKVGREKWYTVWDFCDAGNLGNLLVNQQTDRPHVANDRDCAEEIDDDEDIEMDDTPDDKFLPETFCWHVLLSMLRALTWLHDGVENVVLGANDLYERRTDNLDWQPILHRNITPQNIFLGYPRRKEWYGPVKLGNYGKLHVSGHCQMGGEKEQPRFSKVIAPHPKVDFATLDGLIYEDARRGSVYPLQSGQPYTMTSEYRALGEIIQAMMLVPTNNVHIRTIQSRNARDNLAYAKYSGRLKNFVVKMMEIDPWRVFPADQQNPRPMYVTSDLYAEALYAFKMYMAQGGDEANAYYTHEMAANEDFVERELLPAREYKESLESVAKVLKQVGKT